ncbi:hypothetical protein H9L19_04825 [Weissella diestrammenae]|uniref:Uncharacterized protein n=2 Tax=Weissella diestrammenae TaxID=1162633 RepID=A0A7G9T3S2_9LACO|nr:hypothetical protein [Weissella diestrammenae]QNN74747.1 hypothetical protein H9L19_04825 [Weissella diestrammenae]
MLISSLCILGGIVYLLIQSYRWDSWWDEIIFNVLAVSWVAIAGISFAQLIRRK